MWLLLLSMKEPRKFMLVQYSFFLKFASLCQLTPNRKVWERSQAATMKDPPNSRFGALAPLDLKKYGENPRTPTSPTVEHLLGGEASRWSPNTSPVFRRDHDPEEDHTHHQKKSVLTKVKERAKKLRHTFSGKKKHSEEGNSTPSWGVSLEDDEDEEEDAEYFGAPMYESELAPEGYKENARQHPREIHVISEKQVLTSSVNQGVQKESERPLHTPNKTLTETVTEKLAPAYATVSDATHAIASRIQGLTLSSSESPETKNQPAVETEKHISPSGRIWDKGVSVKEYIKHKFEPGEDDRALSQVITDAMSPRRSPREGGMVEKVKDAVTSFLWKEEPSQYSAVHSASSSSTSIPVSTNAHEVEEENHGKILQPN